MLELYQAYADWTDMMELIESLVSELAEDVTGSTVLVYQGRTLDLTPPWRRAPMAELVSEAIGRPVRRPQRPRRARGRTEERRRRRRPFLGLGQALARALREDRRDGSLGTGLRDRVPCRGLPSVAAPP